MGLQDVYKRQQAWPHLDQNIINYILLQSDVEILVDELATHIPFSYPEKQKILEEMDLKERCELMLVMLEEELDVLKLKQKIQQKVKVNVDKNQKEYMLREQMKVIREELGEDVYKRQIMDSLNSTKNQDYVYCISVQGHGDYPTTQIIENPEITVEGIEDEACLLYTSL